MQDLTTITTPLALLDKATVEALKNCGGPYDRWSQLAARWEQYLDDMTPSFDDGLIYRQRPEPTRPLVVRDWSVFADWVKAVTRDKDGRIDVWDGKPEPVIDQWDCPRGVGGAELSHQLPPAVIDPGTCDWREAIAERPDEGGRRVSVSYSGPDADGIMWLHMSDGESHSATSLGKLNGGITHDLLTRAFPKRAVWEDDQ